MSPSSYNVNSTRVTMAKHNQCLAKIVTRAIDCEKSEVWSIDESQLLAHTFMVSVSSERMSSVCRT